MLFNLQVFMKKTIKRLLKKFGFSVTRIVPKDEYYLSLYEKYKSYTMIPSEYFIKNLELISKYENIAGCIVECGVWRGGMSAAMAEILKNRKSYLYDSFEGLPEAKEIDGIDAINWQKNTAGSSYFNNCKAEMEYAKKAMLLSQNNHKLIKGWFNETLCQTIPDEPIAILRLDADWYESTMICLEQLFPKVKKGGLIIFDDYNIWDGCSKAVHDYLSKTKSKSRIFNTVDGIAYIIKND